MEIAKGVNIMGMIKIGNQFINSNNILQAEITELLVYTGAERNGIGFFGSFFASENDYMTHYPVLKLVTKDNENPKFNFRVISGKNAVPFASAPNPQSGLIFISNKKGFKTDINRLFEYWDKYSDNVNDSMNKAVRKFIYSYGNAKFIEIEEDLESYADKLFGGV